MEKKMTVLMHISDVVFCEPTNAGPIMEENIFHI
jgi:hypothetical protein